MARTLQEIKKSLGAAFVASPVVIAVYGLNPALSFEEQFSSVSIESLIFDVVAFAAFALEKLFDTHDKENKELLAKEKTLRTRWLAEMAKKFQYGDALVYEQDYYDNTGVDEATVAAKKVVKFSAAVDTGTQVRIKIAGIVAGALAPITAPQLAALVTYMNKIKGAGQNLAFVNSAADTLKLVYKIYYNPLVLDATGKRLDGTNDTPIQSAIQSYLTNGIEFDGFFVPSACTDLLQQVDGVKVPSLQSAQARYGMLPFGNIVDFYQPDAGYLRLAPSDLTLIFEASPI